jgi:hypothetical protein
MSVSSTTNRAAYSGNGSTTVFSFPYLFESSSDLVVIERDTTTGAETTKVLSTDYTVSGAGNPVGGSVTMGSAPASGKTLTIYRNPAPTQGLHLTDNDPLPAADLETALDKVVLLYQRALDYIGRAVKLSEGYSGSFDPSLPPLVVPSGMLIVKSDGTGFQYIDTTTFVGPVGPTGATGATGANGADGYSVLNGSGAPGAGLGVNGDFYIDTTAHSIYGPKAAGAWGSSTSLVGPTGSNGTNGQGVPTGGTANQVLAKIDGVDYNTQWVTPSASGASPTVTGSRGTPQSISAAGGIAFTGTNYFNSWYVQGSGGAVTVTANPQIAAATNDNQRLTLIGRSNTNTLTVSDGTGLDLNGPMTLQASSVLGLIWDGTNWVEEYRRQ